MDLTTLVISFSAYIILLILVIGVYSYIRNKKSSPKIFEFKSFSEKFNLTIFKNIKIEHLDINHHKTRISPFGRCDLYLFENKIAILRNQEFIFKMKFEPIIITNQNCSDDEIFDTTSFNSILPKSIKFTKYKKDELVIEYIDPIYKNFKTVMRLKKLTSTQMQELRKIETWTKN